MTAGGGGNLVLRLLGLGYRARQVVVGVDAVRTGLQRDRCCCLVLAADASARTRDKVVRLAQARRVPLVPGPIAETLGRQLGRPPVMVVGVVDPALGRGIVQAGATAPA